VQADPTSNLSVGNALRHQRQDLGISGHGQRLLSLPAFITTPRLLLAKVVVRRTKLRLVSPLSNDIPHRAQNHVRWDVRWPAVQTPITFLLDHPTVDNLGNAPLRPIGYESIPVEIPPAAFPTDLRLGQLAQHVDRQRHLPVGILRPRLRRHAARQHVGRTDLVRQTTIPAAFTTEVVVFDG
jgi:hypothetical protein